jgi:hypothetical protein
MKTTNEPKTASLGDSGPYGMLRDRRDSRCPKNKKGYSSQLEAASAGWILLVGRRNLATTMLNIIARLEISGPVRVLDGGWTFDDYPAVRAANRMNSIVKRVMVTRATTCHQVYSVLEAMPVSPVPLVILDLLETFYDASVARGERKRLLKACIRQLQRLEVEAGTIVSARITVAPSRDSFEMQDLLQTAAADAFILHPASEVSEPMRLL